MSRLRRPIGADDHVLGRADARVALVEYGDYQCPFCGTAHVEVAKVLRQTGELTQYAFRHFPLTQVHPDALLAAQAAEAAGVQGKFWEMHDILFSNQGALDRLDLLAYAEALRLDVARFAEELRSGAHLERVTRDVHTGVRSGVNGTPTFFLNASRFDDRWDAPNLVAAIAAAAEGEPRRISGA